MSLRESEERQRRLVDGKTVTTADFAVIIWPKYLEILESGLPDCRGRWYEFSDGQFNVAYRRKP